MDLPDGELPYVNFLNAERAKKFWGYLSAILYMGMPFALIGVAIFIVGYVVEMVVQSISGNRKDDDDDDDDDW